MTNFLIFKRSKEILEYHSPVAKFEGNAFLPQVAFIPISIGEKYRHVPLVMRGETIREGQIVARGLGAGAVNIYSSIPGIVGNAVTFDLHNIGILQAIPVRLEGSFDILGRTVANYSYREIGASELLHAIDYAGVINTSSTNYESLAFQLREALNAGNSTKKKVYINLFDKDPSCGLDSILFDEFYKEVADGISIIAKILDTQQVVCIHKFSKYDIKKKEAIMNACTNCQVEFVNANKFYPFLKNYSSRKKQEQFWIDVPAALYTCEVSKTNNPITSSYVLISGKAINESKVLRVRIGTPIGSLIEECGGFKINPDHIILNGLIHGYSVNNLDIPITKTLKSIHISGKDTLKNYTRTECINCGRCFNSCPIYLEPKKIVKAIENNSVNSEIIKQMQMCNGCSCCSATCPARIPISSIIKSEYEKLIKGEYK